MSHALKQECNQVASEKYLKAIGNIVELSSSITDCDSKGPSSAEQNELKNLLAIEAQLAVESIAHKLPKVCFCRIAMFN